MFREEYLLKRLRNTEEFQSFSQKEWDTFLTHYYQGDMPHSLRQLYESALEKARFKPKYTKDAPE